MGTGLGTKAVVEVSEDKTVRVDGVIIDSPFHSFEYAFKQYGQDDRILFLRLRFT